MACLKWETVACYGEGVEVKKAKGMLRKMKLGGEEKGTKRRSEGVEGDSRRTKKRK